MSAQDHADQPLLPREPMDLPKPREALPTELPDEIPAHAASLDARQDEADYGPVRTLLSWHAPGRPFRMRGKEYFLNILVIVLAVEVILFLFSQYMLMLLVLALVFLNYALTTIPPIDFRYKISTEGIMVQDRFFLWQELYDFYFKRIEGEDVLIVRTKSLFPGALMITMGQMHKEHLKDILVPYLPFREVVKPSFTEKAGDWLSHTFPLDKRPTP
jgi:hypothetical protein